MTTSQEGSCRRKAPHVNRWHPVSGEPPPPPARPASRPAPAHSHPQPAHQFPPAFYTSSTSSPLRSLLPRSRDLARVCAQARLWARRGPRRPRGIARHRLRRAKDPATAGRRLPPHHTHSLPVTHHSHPSLHPSPPPQLHPPPSPRASHHPTPQPRWDRARGRIRALFRFGSFFVFSFK